MVEQLGQYKILDRIGAGGMGDVYRARDTRLGRTVAIKVLSAAVADDAARRERFMREARAAAALSHPNIAALYEIGEDAGELFLAFEYVPGETLRALIGGRPLNPRRAIDLGVQIADALADAHAEGIVHRDIKPDNIIVTPKGNAKILDFGLATWTAGGAERAHAAEAATMMATSPGMTIGTVAYMSPEQALGEAVDQRTDIFSLGIVMFEMLTGKPPFSGATATALSLQIVQAPAPAPSSINKSLPKEFDGIVLKALAKSLNQRYESAAVMAAELRALAAVLDVRSGTSEPADLAVGLPRAASSSSARGARAGHLRPRRHWSPVAVVLLLGAIAAGGIWLERDPIRKLWRRTLGPPPAPVIAVIPLELAGADRSQTYFADGLTEDLITRLGQTPGLKVLGRSATRDYRGRAPRDVAQELGAGVVLTGSVRPAGDTVKISLELIDPDDGTDVWTGQFTRDVKDVFAVQADVAEQVAQALRVTLRPTASSARAASRLVDRRAYELYLRGRQAAAERRLSDAADFYTQAIAADAGLAEAFAGLAETFHLEATFLGDPDPRRRDQLRSAADRAFQLDPDLAAANVAMGLASESLADTLKYLRRAIELDPSYTEAYHQVGDQVLDFDPDVALRFYRRSLQIDPEYDSSRGDTAVALALLQRWEEADRALAAVKTSPRGPLMRALFRIIENRPEPALESLRAIPTIRQTAVPWLAYVIGLRAGGRSDDAFREASQLIDRFPSVCDARAVLAGLTLDRRQSDAAHRLADPLLRAGRADSPAPGDLRCAVAAAAAMNDGRQASALLARIASNERWLRYWALDVGIFFTGRMMLQGRFYPWTNIAGDAAIRSGREALDAAYAREREIAKTALAGLP
ncbi:MAG: hypothetical protein DMG04_11650 [Acidobacteria bacterium]|nr:MAG: hypothetical protein DMG04_11650 [Acidobacteriota bacterium]